VRDSERSNTKRTGCGVRACSVLVESFSQQAPPPLGGDPGIAVHFYPVSEHTCLDLVVKDDSAVDSTPADSFGAGTPGERAR
jgi:hypothetical protein